MGLASALSTALTGLTAAETTIDVVGNNLANSNTVGFKASSANFATQFLRTQSLGSAPTDGNGGTNPRQIGLGTIVADITPNFSQGTIQISSNAMDMAIQGDGFFIIEGSSGEHLYTRNGIFKLNAQNELTTITGSRVLGYGVDDQFEIQSTVLEPMTIPLGNKQVCKATENVFLQGTLKPDGLLATEAEILETGILGDGQYSRPTSAGDEPAASQAPDVATEGTAGASVSAAGGSMGQGVYYYKIVFADGTVTSQTNTEGMASTAFSAEVLPGGNAISLSDIPVDANSCYKTRRIYRTVAGAAETDPYYCVGEITDNVLTTFTDKVDDATLVTQEQLNTDTLSGNYKYYVTWVNSSGVESRPSPEITMGSITDGRIQLRNLPAADPTDQWVSMRIYRNTTANPDTFYRVAQLTDVATTTDLTYTDCMSDADLELAHKPVAEGGQGWATLDKDGPRITTSTLLVNVVQRELNVYTNLFQEGKLSFAARKGNSQFEAQTMTVDGSTTVGDLTEFLGQCLGIQIPPGSDPDHQIPDSQTATGTARPGARVLATGQIQIVGNTGASNTIEVRADDLMVETATTKEGVNLGFTSTQAAAGESAATDFIVYDSLGIPVRVRLTAVMESKTTTSTTYRWFADSPDNEPATGHDIAVGTGLISFDQEGNFITATADSISIERRQTAALSPLQFSLDFSQISGLDGDSALAVTRQDGSAPGVLTSFIVGEDGRIRGVFSNGITRDLGQIRLARFANPTGLEQKGENLFGTGVNSGLPVEGNPGEQGIGSIVAGATELSNTDVGSNLIDLILASTMYRGNTRVITTVQQMLDELLSLRR